MKSIQVILMLCYHIICWSLVYMLYFNWFIAPVFDIRELNYAQGIAIYMFSRVLKYTQIRDLYYKDVRLEYRDNIWAEICIPWVALLIGVFIYSYF